MTYLPPFRGYRGEVAAMHEWLGMGFIVALVLHLVRHRKPLSGLLEQERVRGTLLFEYSFACRSAKPQLARIPLAATGKRG